MRRITIFVTKKNAGGAFLATFRLFSLLTGYGYSVQFITIDDIKRERHYFVKKIIEKIYRHLIVKRGQHVTLSLAGADDNFLEDTIRESDILVLSWINDGLLNYRNLKTIMLSKKPVFWRLSDMWALTGGCHYAGSCFGFELECRSCPKENAVMRHLSVTKFFQKKKQLAFRSRTLPINILSPSAWLDEAVKNSVCFSENLITSNVIGTCCDEKIFYKRAEIIKEIRNRAVPKDKFVLTFGAKHFSSDKRKGLSEFLSAIRLLPKEISKKIFVIFFGEDGVVPSIPVDNINVGEVEHSELAQVFNISDTFIMCSSEENFANTIIEALMCGCPVVASDQGGSREIIANEINGYTFTLDDGHDLALKICKLVNDADFSREQISHETSLKYSSAVKAAELDRILQNACKLEE